LAGVKPKKCLEAGIASADLKKVLQFRSIEDKNFTLSDFAVRTGMSRCTCNNLKKIYQAHKRRRA
jgi:response regulator of citrate/malate metabolism